MRHIDPFSFQCGAIHCFCEMVGSDVKPLAFSHPVDTAQERDDLIAYAQEVCATFGTRFYIEDSPLLTDLFPAAHSRGKYHLLFYREEHILEQYLRLKDRKATLVAGGAYFGGNRNQIAWELGKLLSYSDDAIRTLITENGDKEQL